MRIDTSSDSTRTKSRCEPLVESIHRGRVRGPIVSSNSAESRISNGTCNDDEKKEGKEEDEKLRIKEEETIELNLPAMPTNRKNIHISMSMPARRSWKLLAAYASLSITLRDS